MPEGSVGVIPEDKYCPSVNTSYKAIAYFEYEQKRTGQICYTSPCIVETSGGYISIFKIRPIIMVTNLLNTS